MSAETAITFMGYTHTTAISLLCLTHNVLAAVYFYDAYFELIVCRTTNRVNVLLICITTFAIATQQQRSPEGHQYRQRNQCRNCSFHNLHIH